MTKPGAIFLCPACGQIDAAQVEIYNTRLRRQQFAMSPVVPTCKQCGAEIEVNHPPVGTELLILNGPCGSGKSTVAENLMQYHGYAAIDGDCLIQAARHRLGSKVEYNSDEALAEIAWEIEILSAFNDRIVLAHIILPEDWERYVILFSRSRLRYRHILLKPDMETLLTRCQTRTCHPGITPEYWVRYFDERLVYPGTANITVMDNSYLTMDETICRIMVIDGSE